MSERLRWSEAEAIVRAYRAEHGASPEVDVETLAQALGTDVTEVRRLAGRRRQFVDGSGVLSAALALVIALAALLAIGPRFLEGNVLTAKRQRVTTPTPASMGREFRAFWYAPSHAPHEYTYRTPQGHDVHIRILDDDPTL